MKLTPAKNLKAAQLAQWKAMPERQDPFPHMNPIPYKTRGSRYGACGIRIDGTPAFIDAVLSNLKSIIQGENCSTRLELARHKVDGSGIKKELPNAEADAECCYIRLHERGHEGKIYQMFVEGARTRQAARRHLVAEYDGALTDDPGLD